MPQRALLLGGQGGKQRGQPVPALPTSLGQQRPSGVGDIDEGRPAVVRVGQSSHQSGAFEALDELCHRGLADSFTGGQRGEPDRALTVGPVQGVRRGGAQLGAVGEESGGQIDGVIQKFPDAFADIAVG